MDVKGDGMSSGSKVRAVGLSHGAVSTVARVCRRSVPYVWKVATGAKRGNPAIRRNLAKRGWQDPRESAA